MRGFPARIAAAVFLAAAGLWASAALSTRRLWEKDASVALCVDGAELRELFPEPAASSRALDRLAAAGVSALALYDVPDPAPRLPPGLSVVFRPGDKPFAPFVPPPSSLNARYILPAGPAVTGVSELSALFGGGSGPFLPWMEFSRQPGLASLARRVPDSVVRGHAADADEMARAHPAKIIARFRRAVRERGARFLYIRFFPGLGPEANLAYVEDLARTLRSNGFRLEPATPRRSLWKKSVPDLPAPLRQLLAFLAAVLGPWLALRLAQARRAWWSGPLLVAATALAAGLLVAAFLSTPDFALGLRTFRGVKPALLLPLLLAVLTLYRAGELRALLKQPLSVGAAAALAGLAAAAGIYLLRSGNDSFLGASSTEARLREFLESLLGVRPRFKEFALGYPLLWLGFFLRSRGAPAARPLLLAGMLAPVSLVNAFCHAHVPLDVTLLRAFHGFWLGALGGLALIHVARTWPKKILP